MSHPIDLHSKALKEARDYFARADEKVLWAKLGDYDACGANDARQRVQTAFEELHDYSGSESVVVQEILREVDAARARLVSWAKEELQFTSGLPCVGEEYDESVDDKFGQVEICQAEQVDSNFTGLLAKLAPGQKSEPPSEPPGSATAAIKKVLKLRSKALNGARDYFGTTANQKLLWAKLGDYDAWVAEDAQFVQTAFKELRDYSGSKSVVVSEILREVDVARDRLAKWTAKEMPFSLPAGETHEKNNIGEAKIKEAELIDANFAKLAQVLHNGAHWADGKIVDAFKRAMEQRVTPEAVKLQRRAREVALAKKDFLDSARSHFGNADKEAGRAGKLWTELKEQNALDDRTGGEREGVRAVLFRSTQCRLSGLQAGEREEVRKLVVGAWTLTEEWAKEQLQFTDVGEEKFGEVETCQAEQVDSNFRDLLAKLVPRQKSESPSEPLGLATVAVKKVLKLRSEALQELGGCFGTEDQKGLLSGKLGGPDPVRCSDATLAFGALSSYCGPGGVATKDVREKLQEARRGLASWAKRSFCPAGPGNEFAESQKAEARRIDDDFQVLSGCLGGEKTAPEDEMSCHRVVDLSGVTSTIVLGGPVFPLSVISLQLRFASAKKRSSGNAEFCGKTVPH